MPGFFGAAGVTPRQAGLLRDAFAAAWADIDTVETATGILGGHAFPPHRALAMLPSGTRVAVDGELAIYRAAPSELFELGDGYPVPTGACKGNLAIVEPSGRCTLCAELTGSFPIHYVHRNGTFAFCSRLRPLSAAFPSPLDPIALLEFVREGWVLAGRSLRVGIRRLMPGQVVTYDPTGDLVEIHETSRVWVGWDVGADASVTAVATLAGERMRAAARRCVPGTSNVAVMMSGGWDSRTLLAAAWAVVGPQQLTSYSHGDLASRELAIARRASLTLGAPNHQEPIDARIYDIELIEKGFQRVENVVFPHWHRAGQVLAQRGESCVAAGVYGEVLGGHYGRAMTLRAAGKIGAVLSSLLGTEKSPEPISASGLAAIQESLRPAVVERPWFITEAFWRSIEQPAEQIRSDFNTDVERLYRRGVTTADQLIEAFVTEHRGSQYITAQILSCRAHLDVALPFADHELLEFSSRIPLAMKIHNTLNRELLRRQAPELLRLPMAATLVPATAPVLVQESSRLVRRMWEDAHWWVHFASGGRVHEPHLAWVNFEFTRRTTVLEALVADLRWEGWDRNALQQCLHSVKCGGWRRPMHPISDVLMKICSADRLLR